MKSVFVIDPGMMEAGGHHAALLETLIHSESEDTTVSVLTHKHLDNELETKAKNNSIQVHRFFSSNFYQHYEDSLELSLSGMQHYIRLLAWEYAGAIKQAAQGNDNNEVVCFYPCLNWEHASAISLALTTLTIDGERYLCTHKVSCMFRPLNINYQSEWLYKYSFGQLAKRSEVELFASDWETKEYYEDLGITIQGFHPCYLLPWSSLNKQKTTSSDTPHLLLYMGDAKENKGFLRLPEVITKAIAKFNGKVKLTVQYTLAWDYPELVPVINTLKRLEKEYPMQVHVHARFWSKDELQSVMATLSGIVCTYDSHTYQNKSSGLAWLCAYYYLPIIFMGQQRFWMHREIERLGITYYHSLTDFADKTNDKPMPTRCNSYYSSLFEDCLTWVVN